MDTREQIVATRPPSVAPDVGRPLWTPAATALLACACAAVAGLVDASPPRVGAGLILALVLPGYALVVLVFPARSLAATELLGASIGASLVVSALGGLLLYAVAGDMSRTAWVLLLLAVTLAASAMGALRRDAPPARAEAVGPRVVYPPAPRARMAFNHACAGAALVLVAVAVSVAREAADRAPAFAELSTVPVTRAGSSRLLIRVGSHEHRASPFTLVIKWNGARFDVSHPIVPAGGEWQLVSEPVPADSRRVSVDLYRPGARTPYLRNVYYPPVPRPASPQRGLPIPPLSPSTLEPLSAAAGYGGGGGA